MSKNNRTTQYSSLPDYLGKTVALYPDYVSYGIMKKQ